MCKITLAKITVVVALYGLPYQQVAKIETTNTMLFQSAAFGPKLDTYHIRQVDHEPEWLKPNVNTQQAITKIAAIFNKYNPSFPYDYRFADEAFNATLKVEVLVGKLARIFAGLAVFISCLGLFGLAAYVAEQRKKEIGIRKVLGASVSRLCFLISGDFIMLVVISCAIASPVAFYFLHEWLQKYEYRITIGPQAFVIAATVTILITLFTISYQAINSALANPVKSLKSE